MTTRKSRGPKLSGTVTVTVVEPHLVFHDGEQRSGTLDGVDVETAAHWAKHGWVTIEQPAVDEKPTPATTDTK